MAKQRPKKLRIVVNTDCKRNCEGCCMKDWNIKKIPRLKSCKGYEIIMLTGGEPMLHPAGVSAIIEAIRMEADSKTQVYMYTAKTDEPKTLANILDTLDGLCITLHDQTDVPNFRLFNDLISHTSLRYKSLRLNVFKGVDISDIDTGAWTVKQDMTWIKSCPLPEGEVLMKM